MLIQKSKCSICGGEFRNLGSHMHQSHHVENQTKNQEENYKEKLVAEDEFIKEKPLSILISELRQILNRYQSQITVKTFEKNGKTSEIEITARIQL